MLGKKKTSTSTRQRTRPAPTNEPRKVFSYYANRAPSETKQRSRIKEGSTLAVPRSPLRARKILTFALFIAIVFLLGFSLFLNAPKVVLTGSPAERVSLQEDAVYTAAAKQIFNNSFINKTKLTFSQSKFQKEFLAKFPEVTSVHVALPLIGKQPVVYVDPSPGTLVFVDKSGISYIVNDQGDVISKNKAEGAQNIVTVHDSAGLSASVGQQILPSTEVSFILAVQQQLERNNITVSSFALPSAAQRLQVHIKDKPYYVIFTFSNDVKQQIGAYVATQKRLDEKHITPAEYIDVRVGERVYYK